VMNNFLLFKLLFSIFVDPERIVSSVQKFPDALLVVSLRT